MWYNLHVLARLRHFHWRAIDHLVRRIPSGIQLDTVLLRKAVRDRFLLFAGHIATKLCTPVYNSEFRDNILRSQCCQPIT